MILILKRERARTGERLDLEAARSDCASLAVADYITAHLAARQSLFFRRKDDTRLDLAALKLKRANGNQFPALVKQLYELAARLRIL